MYSYCILYDLRWTVLAIIIFFGTKYVIVLLTPQPDVQEISVFGLELSQSRVLQTGHRNDAESFF